MAARPALRRARAVARVARTALHLAHGVSIALLSFPRMAPPERAARVQWWSIKVLRLMGVQLVQSGALRPGAKLLVANHVSWLDIMAIHSVCPEARFVSKADVRRWPVLGTLVAAAGTLFIERERKRDALRVVHTMAQSLAAGETVAIFPEGTTSDGRTLLPFHANLLQAAVSSESPIQSVVLAYSDSDAAVSETVSYVGDTTLIASFWRIACGDGVQVAVRLLPARAARHADRRRLAALLSAEIDGALRGTTTEYETEAGQPLA
ncbi:MAG: lysophospholipid acyltransferase family protein [Ideonella sp.]